jgi:hypothetical protein
MAKMNTPHRDAEYAAVGHPSLDQLMAEQGTGPITGVYVLHGDFWPEEESIEDFLDILRDYRLGRICRCVTSCILCSLNRFDNTAVLRAVRGI